MALPMPTPAVPKKRDWSKTPQEVVGDFWDKFSSKRPGKVTSIFPRSLYASLLPDVDPDGKGISSARNAAESYETAAKECREKVKRIVRECGRVNEKFTDPDFDVESDRDLGLSNCLNGLVRPDPVAIIMFEDAGMEGKAAAAGEAVQAAGGARSGRMREAPMPTPPPLQPEAKGDGVRATKAKGRGGVMGDEVYDPGSIHRLDWIFESPNFTVDGYSSSDIKQGGNGDCWWLAAVATIASRKDLMDKVCVARDEEAGVYGFVFMRDGEWQSVVVDDMLYVSASDFDFYGDYYDSTGKRAREYRKRNQTGSEALYFAKCADKNETWLPLLEKAYAKLHGDYEAISGGWSGEAVEDMTGGVTTTVATNRVLRKEKLWKELVNSDGNFVFALSAIGTGWDWTKGGLALGHAYSILKAREEVGEDGEKVRLVQVRNPWGERAWNGIGEWNGPWSDGSKEWTPYWLKKMNHKFGDDGLFWMSYDDMLSTFLYLHRTRLFDEHWTVVQQWTSVQVSWVTGFLQTKFIIDVKKGGLVVISLIQLDERYFYGLEGQYTFALHFLLKEANAKDGEHLCRVRPVHSWENRSVSCELELEAGKYEVIPMLTATRAPTKPMVEDIVKDYSQKNPQKLRQVGMLYDLAHAKGGIPDEDKALTEKQEKEKAKEKEKKLKEKEKKKREKEKEKKKKLKEKKKKLKEKAAAKKAKLQAKKAAADAKKAEEAAKKATAAAEKAESSAEKAEDSADKAEVSAEKAEEAAEEKKTEEKKEEAKPEEKKEEAKPEEPKKEEPKAESSKDAAAEKAKAEESKPADDKVSTTATDGSGDTSATPDTAASDEAKAAEEEEEEEEESSESEDDDDEEEEEEEEEEEKPVIPEIADDDPLPWNAACVIGLRVHARDTDVSITMVKPKSDEEGSSLTIDAAVSAGATM